MAAEEIYARVATAFGPRGGTNPVTNSDEKDATLEASGEFQRRVLSEINAEWNHNPYVVLHGLIELAGAIASAMIQHDAARPEVVLGMVNALQTRVSRDAALVMAPESELWH
jgi:hypothetical protein